MSLRRVLIVSPSFPPSNSPDSQRVRMCLPYFAQHGWEPTILALRAEEIAAPNDPDLLRTVPPEIRVVRCGAIPLRLTSHIGMRTPGMRCLYTLRAAGNQLLTETKFDCIYFSTTVFLAMTMGANWKARHGVPYVVDIQDPIVQNHYHEKGLRPPGGSLKFALSQALARKTERVIFQDVSRVIVVSDAYTADLAHRYTHLDPSRFTTLPFPCSERDLQVLRGEPVPNPIFSNDDGLQHWVFTGVLNPGNIVTLRVLFRAWAALIDTRFPAAQQLRMHFVGTTYGDLASFSSIVYPLAREFGLGEKVTEQPSRLGYLRALQIQLDAAVVMVLGTTDRGYTASKVRPVLLTGKPVLGFFHEASNAAAVMQSAGREPVVFSDADLPQVQEQLMDRIRSLLTVQVAVTPISDALRREIGAEENARIQCGIFEEATHD